VALYRREKNILITDQENTSDISEEAETETAGKVNAGMKMRHPVWNDFHYMEGKAN